MLIVTDMNGQPVTEVSHPCGLYTAISQMPAALQSCIQHWGNLAETLHLEPRFAPGHLGLLCARGLVRVENELKGMVIVGGIAPDTWPPPPDEIEAMAVELEVEPRQLEAHIGDVFYLDEAQRAGMLPFVQRIAGIISHIANERHTLVSRLESIARLTAL